jgi:toxin CptA
LIRAVKILLPLLTIPLLWASLFAATRLRVDVGVWGDHTYLDGLNGVERSSTEDYRWTTGATTLTLPNLNGGSRELRMRAHGWRPDGLPSPEVRISVAGRAWGRVQTTPDVRVYTVLLPPDDTNATTSITFQTDPIYASPSDGRTIGVALDWIELHTIERSPGPLWHLARQIALVALLHALLWALALPAAWSIAPAALSSGALIWANLQQPLWVSQSIVGWLIIAGLLLLATWLLRPRVSALLTPWMSPRQAHIAWALIIAALALRLFGSVHPLFNSHDVDVHMRWLETVSGGQLYLYSTPGELRNRQTFNPPAGYVLLLPLWLALPSPRLVVQVGVGLFDALGCVLLLPLARALRLPATAGLSALALYLALPINTTILWWGFATNTIAQATWLLLLWLLLRLARRPDRITLAAFVVCCAVSLLMHAGALVLIVAILGLLLAFGWRQLTPGRNTALLGIALALLITVPIYFTAAAGPILERPPDEDNRIDISQSLAKGWNDRELRLNLVGRGMQLGLLPPLLALAPVALASLLLARSRPPIQAPLIAAWLLVCGGFFAVYMGLGLTTRYIYFAAPLLCLAVGALLAHLSRRPWGRAVALTLTLFVIWSGTALWFAGVLLRDKPSIVSLTQ